MVNLHYTAQGGAQTRNYVGLPARVELVRGPGYRNVEGRPAGITPNEMGEGHLIYYLFTSPYERATLIHLGRDSRINPPKVVVIYDSFTL